MKLHRRRLWGVVVIHCWGDPRSSPFSSAACRRVLCRLVASPQESRPPPPARSNGHGQMHSIDKRVSYCKGKCLPYVLTEPYCSQWNRLQSRDRNHSATTRLKGGEHLESRDAFVVRGAAHTPHRQAAGLFQRCKPFRSGEVGQLFRPRVVQSCNATQRNVSPGYNVHIYI